MKRKLNLLILSALILLILFIVNVNGKLDNRYVTPDADLVPPESTDVIPASSKENTEIQDNLSNETTETKDDFMLKNNKTNQDLPKATTDTNNGLMKETAVLPMTKEVLRQLAAGTIIDIKEHKDTLMNISFYYEEIKDDIKIRIVGKSYRKDCTVPFEDLRYVRVLYYGFDKETHIGELIVNKAIASDIVDIFTELYEKEYPIEQMVLIDEYDADDNTSMASDNTSSFNYRFVPGSAHLSKHALGLAIDINPLYNPYIQYNKNETVILPVEGSDYVDRTLNCPYYINEDDLCYKAFTKRGFTWGGFWETEPDYQHFQKTID